MYSQAYVLFAGSSVQPLDVSPGDETARLGGDEDGRLSLTAGKNLLHYLDIGGVHIHQAPIKRGEGVGLTSTSSAENSSESTLTYKVLRYDVKDDSKKDILSNTFIESNTLQNVL